MTRARARRRRSARATGAWMERKLSVGSQKASSGAGCGTRPWEARAGARLTSRGGTGGRRVAWLGPEHSGGARRTCHDGRSHSAVWSAAECGAAHDALVAGRRGRAGASRGHQTPWPTCTRSRSRVQLAHSAGASTNRDAVWSDGHSGEANLPHRCDFYRIAIPVKDPHSQNGRKCR